MDIIRLSKRCIWLGDPVTGNKSVRFKIRSGKTSSLWYIASSMATDTAVVSFRLSHLLWTNQNEARKTFPENILQRNYSLHVIGGISFGFLPL